jgi:hypothetical protein
MDETNVTQKITERTRPTDGMEFRTQTLEKHNQIRKISSLDGLTYFDTETGEIFMKDGSITMGNITIKDGAIVMSDGSNKRVVLDGNSMKVSQAGYDADTTTDDKLIMSSDFNMYKIVKIMTGTITTGGVGVEYSSTVSHDLGYKPMVFGSVISSEDSKLRPLPAAFFNTDTFRVVGAFAQIQDVTDTQATVKLEICSFLGLSSFGANGKTLNYKLYFVRETAN